MPALPCVLFGLIALLVAGAAVAGAPARAVVHSVAVQSPPRATHAAGPDSMAQRAATVPGAQERIGRATSLHGGPPLLLLATGTGDATLRPPGWASTTQPPAQLVRDTRSHSATAARAPPATLPDT